MCAGGRIPVGSVPEILMAIGERWNGTPDRLWIGRRVAGAGGLMDLGFGGRGSCHALQPPSRFGRPSGLVVDYVETGPEPATTTRPIAASA